VTRGWLGVAIQGITPAIAKSLGMNPDEPTGALVATVTPNSPAARAGLKLSDLIVAIDGQTVDDPNAFDYRFATKALGGSAKLGIMRAGREHTMSVALETIPELPREELVIGTRSPFQGAKVSNITPAVADELRQAAEARGLSLSATAAVLLAEALRADVEHQHAALLEAVIDRTIRSSLSQHLNRLGELSFRAALDSDETRRLVLTLLVSEIGAEQTKQFRREAHSASWQRLKEPLAVPCEHQDGVCPASQARS
jgi:membrane-associated protease RseP (regulator of RpoE activity)